MSAIIEYNYKDTKEFIETYQTESRAETLAFIKKLLMRSAIESVKVKWFGKSKDGFDFEDSRLTIEYPYIEAEEATE